MKKINSPKKSNAFTIVEAMVVVLVVGILATLAVGGYKKYMAKTMIANAISGARPMQKGIEDFYQQQGYFPGTNDLLPYVPGATMNSGYPYYDGPNSDYSVWLWSWVSNCTPNTTGCDDLGISSYPRGIYISFDTPSYGGTYLNGIAIVLIANVTNSGINWLCMPYSWSGSSTLAADGVTPMATLLPAGCHNAALDRGY